MTAIKQHDLPILDNNDVEIFDITGRNTFTNKASRMLASEMLANTVSNIDLADTLTNYATTDEIPTKTSQLDNDSGFITKSDVKRVSLLDIKEGDNLRGALVTFDTSLAINLSEALARTLILWATVYDDEVPESAEVCTLDKDGLYIGDLLTNGYVYTANDGWVASQFQFRSDCDIIVESSDLSDFQPASGWTFADSAVKIVDPLLWRIIALEQNADYRRYGDLSVTGGQGISVVLGGVTLLVRRIDTTTLEIRATAVNDTAIPLTHRYSGNNTSETLRETFTATPVGTVIGTIGVGQYVMAEFWTKIGNSAYDIVAGSDDDMLTSAWVEVSTKTVS